MTQTLRVHTVLVSPEVQNRGTNGSTKRVMSSEDILENNAFQ